MAESFISTKSGQFSYFSKQLHQETWRGKYVLDFGGNVGNLLRDPSCTIDEERYWCLDIVKEALERGRLAYPKAHWVFYNRYSFAFNPDGIPGLPIPRLEREFDFIVAFSVFTNTKPSEMFELVQQLKMSLLDDGILAFTFIDPNHWSQGGYNGSNFQWRLEAERRRGLLTEKEKYTLLRIAQFAEWFMLVNGRYLYVESEAIDNHSGEGQNTCYVFHTEEYMRRHFPDAAILPPVNNEMQHCCVIKRLKH
jgi:SAM-dependent methyltransferase